MIYYETDRGTIMQGDVFSQLAYIPDGSINTCITSPPYYGHRDYEHDDQIGQELTPADYIKKLVEVFRIVRAKLRVDGTLWVNIGDSYNGSGGDHEAHHKRNRPYIQREHGSTAKKNIRGYKPKDLIGIPWMLAFALRGDGWTLRQDIIWSKPNPMPQSVKDRCSTSHEYIFLLAKNRHYYYDIDAIREPHANSHHDGRRTEYDTKPSLAASKDKGVQVGNHPLGRNKRSVWNVQVGGFSGAHFAVFPTDLIEPCILAGVPEDGTVLDPFFGSGTTGYTAERLDRKWIGIELNSDYCKIARERIMPIAKSKQAMRGYFV
jgi:DNA modification methylase